MWIKDQTGGLLNVDALEGIWVSDSVIIAKRRDGNDLPRHIELFRNTYIEAVALFDAIAEWLDIGGNGPESVATTERVVNPVLGDTDVVYIRLPHHVFDIPKWLEEHQKGEGK